MFLKELKINGFKNVYEARLRFCEKINCFVGKNGSGKTNILDAIYYMSMCKSYFNVSDTQNIRLGDDFFILNALYEDDSYEIIDVYCGVNKERKKLFRKNKKDYTKLSDHIGLIPLIMVAPNDTVLIDGGSEERRKLVDNIISQADKNYLQTLIKYNKLLLHRNTILKNFKNSLLNYEVLEIIDEQLCKCGEFIFARREEFLAKFISVFKEYYRLLGSSKEIVDLVYRSSIKKGKMSELLKDNFERDRVLLYTSVGIHRDDLLMNLDGLNIKKFASQGQKKSYLIALKLAQYEWLYSINGIKPILLLDDIFDKLDSDRVNKLLGVVNEFKFGQIFITDTNREHIDELLSKSNSTYTLFSVDDGSINIV